MEMSVDDVSGDDKSVLLVASLASDQPTTLYICLVGVSRTIYSMGAANRGDEKKMTLY